MPFVDFAELKSRVSIEQAVVMLSLSLNKAGAQLRGPCPVCNAGGDRALVVTPAKNLYFCFAAKTGGDQIALAAHIKGIKVTEAASFLAGGSPVPVPRNRTVLATVPPAPPEKGFRPLDYLLPQHEAVQGLGISKETAAAFGAGYAPKGILRGRLAIPIHDREGTLLAYCGRTVKNESPTLTFPNGFDPHSVIFGAHKVKTGELYLVRDPLQVLTAYEAGVENVVAFLTTITAQQLEQLASLMDEKNVETIELF
jgi:DNA primase